jgi:hypothetical protein
MSYVVHNVQSKAFPLIAMQVYEGVEVYIHAFTFSTLDEGEW